MTKISDIKRMVDQTQEHFGRIDILINNAEQGYDAPIEKTNIDTFHYMAESKQAMPPFHQTLQN